MRRRRRGELPRDQDFGWCLEVGTGQAREPSALSPPCPSACPVLPCGKRSKVSLASREEGRKSQWGSWEDRQEAGEPSRLFGLICPLLSRDPFASYWTPKRPWVTKNSFLKFQGAQKLRENSWAYRLPGPSPRNPVAAGLGLTWLLTSSGVLLGWEPHLASFWLRTQSWLSCIL